MTRVRKSPNMMSTTGRSPVMAAPRPIPVKPASEIGVSITRSGPNSSTSPLRTLKAVPASATSSPMTNTVGSRRSSSANASLIAWPSVTSRIPTAVALGVDMLAHLGRVGIRRLEGEVDTVAHLRHHLLLDPLQTCRVHPRFQQPPGQQPDRIALVTPDPLLLPGAIGSVHVPHVVAVKAVGVAEQEAGTVSTSSSIHRLPGGGVDDEDVLPVDLLTGDSEGPGSGGELPSGGLPVARVLVIEVVLADVDHGQPPERGHVHGLVEEPLP